MKWSFIFLILISQGCGMSNSVEIDRFNFRVSELIGDAKSVKVTASQLTDFEWDSLCFQRKDLLQLTFSSGGSVVMSFKFSYEDYFTDEGYVKGSLDGKCISNKDYIVIERKYPGYSKTIGFMSIEKYKE